MTASDKLRGLPVVAIFHVSHFRNDPAMRNNEFVERTDFAPGRHELVLATDYAALLDEVAELRGDAMRYRWLRDSALEIAWNQQISYSPGYDEGDAERMDAAIDAALAPSRKGGGEDAREGGS